LNPNPLTSDPKTWVGHSSRARSPVMGTLLVLKAPKLRSSCSQPRFHLVASPTCTHPLAMVS
jgi:hypothetical protein